MTCGSMLRECIRHEHLAKIVLQHPEFYKFFQYVEVRIIFFERLHIICRLILLLYLHGVMKLQVSTFDIASDAFATFKELITKHKALCAEFLELNYDEFFKAYQNLLNSENYVTRRQSLKVDFCA